MGTDPISILHGQDLSATVRDIHGQEYTYSISFIDEDQEDNGTEGENGNDENGEDNGNDENNS